MSLRRVAVAVLALALTSGPAGIALASPAAAVPPAPFAAPPPVDSVTVDGQVQGPAHSWEVTASWPAATGATSYAVSITNLAATRSYATRDVASTTATLKTDALVAGNSYRVEVVAGNADGEAGASTTTFVAMTLDTTGPTGSFTVSPTAAFLTSDFLGLDDPYADLTVRQLSLADDSPGPITRKVLAGDGSPATAWDSGTRTTVSYTRPGTFTPKVQLTDVHGNTSTVTLSPVTITLDQTAPAVRIVLPPKRVRNSISSWRTVYGTATDSGAGVEAVLIMAMQKRAGIWYAYDFERRKWLKGNKREQSTLTKTKATPAFVLPDADGVWRSPRLRGLKKGKLALRTAAFDAVGNLGLGRVVRQSLTRR